MSWCRSFHKNLGHLARMLAGASVQRPITYAAAKDQQPYDCSFSGTSVCHFVVDYVVWAKLPPYLGVCWSAASFLSWLLREIERWQRIAMGRKIGIQMPLPSVILHCIRGLVLCFQ